MPPAEQDAADLVEIQSMQCGFCSLDLEYLNISQREAHYEQHFINDTGKGKEGSEIAPIDVESVESLQESLIELTNASGPSTLEKSPAKNKFKLVKETDVFWYPAQEIPPPSSFTPGLIHILRKGLLKGHTRGNVRRAVLCVDNAVLVHREPWDATWGCGYRNFLMSCSVLMSQTRRPLYFPLLDSPLPPSIRNIQAWIEAAWEEGFDPEGKKDLQKLVGTRKWIGTSDLWVAFVFRGIPALLVDFDLRKQAQGSQLLIDWVVNYFSPKKSQEKSKNAFQSITMSPIMVTDKMPIILQHDGHSRTVVGYEIDKNGSTNLLMFDPAYRPSAEVRNLALAEFAKSRIVSPQGSDDRTAGSDLSQTSRASSSTLKRKRSMNVSSQGENIASNGANNTTNVRASSSNVLSPLKNGLQKVGLGREDKEPDFYGMLRKFRLEPKNLSKKNQYQILYFPMDAPLTDYQKMQRKEVRSIKIS